MKRKPLTFQQSIARVQIFWDEQAFVLEGGHPKYLAVKPCHDELFQAAMDLWLASGVLVMERAPKPLLGLEEISSIFAERPTWWPANQTAQSRSDLRYVPLDAFERNWTKLRERAEHRGKDGKALTKPRTTLWHDDPALVQKQRGSKDLLCRTASVGHEGHVFYFVYPGEDAWQAAVCKHGFELFGSGEDVYRSLIAGPLSLP